MKNKHAKKSPGTKADVAESSKVKLKRKDYENELRDLQAELCAVQEWVKEPMPQKKVKLPKRIMKHAYDDEATMANRRWVPESY